MRAQRDDGGRVVRRLLTHARDRLALVLATLLLALLHDDGLAHAAIDTAASRARAPHAWLPWVERAAADVIRGLAKYNRDERLAILRAALQHVEESQP